MRILVTGSRNWTDRAAIYADLDRLWDLASGRLTLVHGWCPKGADKMADDWAATRHGVNLERYAADWQGSCRTTCPPGHRRSYARAGLEPRITYCPLAGHYRNQEMVDRGADQVRAYQVDHSRGTQDCIDRARAAGLNVTIIEPGDPVSENAKRVLRHLRDIDIDIPGAETWGYDIMRATGLQSSTVYPILQRLERDGQVTSRWVERRRYYRLKEDHQ